MARAKACSVEEKYIIEIFSYVKKHDHCLSGLFGTERWKWKEEEGAGEGGAEEKATRGTSRTKLARRQSNLKKFAR